MADETPEDRTPRPSRPGRGSIPAPVSSGIPGLDDILRGGFPSHRLHLIEGDPGSGKTTLGLQFLLEGRRRGERGLHVTLSETAEELEAVAASHGWSLEGVGLFELPRAGDSLGPEAHYTLFHPSDVELGETTSAVLAEVDRIQPSRVVFDSLSEMRLLARDPLVYRRQILALKQFFVGRRCTVLLLDDRTSEAGDRQLYSLAHGVVTLEHVAPSFGAERRRLRIVKMRGLAFAGGYHDFRIVIGGIEIYPRLPMTNEPRRLDAAPVSSGVPELDTLLGGGLTPGTTTLLLGPAGVGKSVLALQYAIAAARLGAPGAIYLFDEVPGTFLTRAAGLGLDLESHLASGRIRLQQVDPAELSPGAFAHAVRHAVERQGVRVLVIDSLNGYLNAMPGEQYLEARLHELFTYLRRNGVLAIAVLAQHGLLRYDVDSVVDLSYLADSVLLLRYFEALGQVRQAISVVKKRTGSHERGIREFGVSSRGIRVGDALHDFQGVLTGVPTFVGGTGLLSKDPHGDAGR